MATEFTLLTPIPHELYNRETEEVEAVEVITPAKAKQRNVELKRLGEPYRWVVVYPLD